MIESMLYGSSDIAQRYFSMTTQLLSKILKELVVQLPAQDIQILINTPSNNTVKIFATGSTASQSPVCLEVKAYSFLNGEYSLQPRIETNDEWLLHYGIKKLEYSVAEHEYYESRYTKMFSISNSSGTKFIEKLKAEIQGAASIH